MIFFSARVGFSHLLSRLPWAVYFARLDFECPASEQGITYPLATPRIKLEVAWAVLRNPNFFINPAQISDLLYLKLDKVVNIKNERCA